MQADCSVAVHRPDVKVVALNDPFIEGDYMVRRFSAKSAAEPNAINNILRSPLAP